MCKQIFLHYNFHVSLGDTTEKRCDLFCTWKSRVRIPYWYSLSLSLLFFFFFSFFFSFITARQSIFYYSLLIKILICDYIICDRPISHMGQEYLFLWLSEIFLSRPACLILGQTCCPKLSIIAIWAASWQNQRNGICAQRRLRSDRASAQSEQSSLSAWRKLGSFASIPNSKFIHFSGYTITYNYMRCNTISNILVATHWTHSEDSDQTRRMPRLIWVLAGRTVILLVLVILRRCHDIIRSSEMNMRFNK